MQAQIGIAEYLTQAPPDILERGEANLRVSESQPWERENRLPLVDTGRQNLLVPHLIERQAGRRPAAIAVRSGDESLTYAELTSRCRRLAACLRERGARPREPVGILLDRSCDLVVAMVTLLCEGMPYVPLDPSHPQQRLLRILENADVRTVLTSKDLVPLADAAKTIDVAEAREQVETLGPGLPAGTDISPEDLAYVIYTSGSTGTPKGVMVRHGGLINLLLSMASMSKIEATDVMLALTTVSFDISGLELLLPLIAGAQTVAVAREIATDGVRLAAAAEHLEATMMQATPLAWRLLREAGWLDRRRFRVALCGGEALHKDLAEDLVRASDSAWNVYGPTETTIWSTAEHLQGGSPVIGKPIANTTLYIWDRNGEPVPAGVWGELYIGGEGVARGYVKQPRLTAERFIPAPWSDQPGSRLYRTGDRVRWRQDGTVEYFGRLDTQVKLRGYRIELGEVEAALARHPHVKEAAVTLHGDGQQEKRLLAFIVEREGCTVSSEQLRAHLHQTLPDYMLPGCFLKLDSLPATPAGKVDRVALSGREVTAQDGEAGEGESRTPMEDLLAGLCSELLGVGRVNIQSSFFNLGGNSLSAMRLISRIQQSLHVELALRRVFEVASLRELASDIEACQRNSCAAPRIAAAIRNHEMPASFAQQRLWFLDRLAPGTSLFNEFVAVRLRGDLDVAALAAALTELVKRHEVLRTVFRVREGRPVQIIHEWNEGGSLILKDLTDQGEEAQLDCLKALTAQESGAPFDLEAGPLLRMQLLRHTKDEYTLFFTAHHIVCDGWSVRVLARELSALYDAFSLAEPSPLEQPAYQYVDYAVWQRQWQQSESFAMQMDYWRRQLTPVPQFRLPATCSAASMTLVGAAASTGFGLSAEQAAKLYDLGRREDSTLFMTLLAVFQVLLSSWTGASDVCVGTDISGRHQYELEPLVGFFVNQLPLRGRVEAQFTFRELLRAARRTCIEAYTHQDLPFEQLIESLHLSGSSPFPLFEAKLVLQNFATGFEVRLRAMETLLLEPTHHKARMPLVLMVQTGSTGLQAAFIYRSDLFASHTMNCLRDQFLSIVDMSNRDPGITVGDLTEAFAGEVLRDRRLEQRSRVRAQNDRWQKML